MFSKGNTYGKGRPLLSSNKVTSEIRDLGADLLKGEIEVFKEKLPTLNDSDYIKAIGLLVKMVMPQLRSTQVEDVTEPMSISVEIIDRIDQVTDKQIDAALDSFKPTNKY